MWKSWHFPFFSSFSSHFLIIFRPNIDKLSLFMRCLWWKFAYFQNFLQFFTFFPENFRFIIQYSLISIAHRLETTDLITDKWLSGVFYGKDIFSFSWKYKVKTAKTVIHGPVFAENWPLFLLKMSSEPKWSHE